LTHFVHEYGLWFLFVIVGLESAGLWLPGETVLIAASVYAANGHLPIEWVIVVAAVAAILGDNAGYWIGREGGRRLLRRLPRIERVLPPAERFFERHGGKTVFLGRFFGGLRVTAAWIAGITRMPWWRFFFWNASGGIVWAVGVGLLAYYAGKHAADALSRYGIYGGIAIGVIVVLLIAVLHLVRRRAMASDSA
jgi:membrane protein DedA with SNARE-associated domain